MQTITREPHFVDSALLTRDGRTRGGPVRYTPQYDRSVSTACGQKYCVTGSRTESHRVYLLDAMLSENAGNVPGGTFDLSQRIHRFFSGRQSPGEYSKQNRFVDVSFLFENLQRLCGHAARLRELCLFSGVPCLLFRVQQPPDGSHSHRHDRDRCSGCYKFQPPLLPNVLAIEVIHRLAMKRGCEREHRTTEF